MRSYDITYCDIEPAVIGMPRVFIFKLSQARNVLLFRLLIHDHGTEPHAFWKMMYHLHIDKATFDNIKFYSHELYGLAESLEYWECGRYSNVIRFYIQRVSKLFGKFCIGIRVRTLLTPRSLTTTTTRSRQFTRSTTKLPSQRTHSWRVPNNSGNLARQPPGLYYPMPCSHTQTRAAVSQSMKHEWVELNNLN
jgi:hypothetical protein